MVAPSPSPVVAEAAALPKSEPGPARPVGRDDKPLTMQDHLRAGRELIAKAQPDAARAAFEAAHELAPSSAQPLIELARLDLAAHRLGDAEMRAEAAVEEQPSSSAAWNTLGRVRLAQDDLPGAELAFMRAAEENPGNLYAWNNLGLTLILSERFADAAAALEQATQADGPEPYMWNNLGVAYERQGRLEEARAAYGNGASAGSEPSRLSLARLEGVRTLEVSSKPPATLTE